MSVNQAGRIWAEKCPVIPDQARNTLELVPDSSLVFQQLEIKSSQLD